MPKPGRLCFWASKVGLYGLGPDALTNEINKFQIQSSITFSRTNSIQSLDWTHRSSDHKKIVRLISNA
ncbi:hypothetical protein CsSME_00004909 [Camellia sinensis var. sinensis]